MRIKVQPKTKDSSIVPPNQERTWPKLQTRPFTDESEAVQAAFATPTRQSQTPQPSQPVQREKTARAGFNLVNIPLYPPEQASASPALAEGIQRQEGEKKDDDLQMKTQEETLGQQEEEVQRKPLADFITPVVQRSSVKEQEEIQMSPTRASKHKLSRKEEVLKWAQGEYGDRGFKHTDFCRKAAAKFGVKTETAQEYIRTLRSEGNLFPPLPEPVSRLMTLSFDSSKAELPKLKVDTMNRREAAGYVNPPHAHKNMRPLFQNAAVSPVDSTRPLDEWLYSPSRRFETHTPTHTQPPVIVKGHGNTVMGHNPDAVTRWNTYGHQQPRMENLEENRQTNFYHGLESREKSNASGGATRERYRSPSPSIGSHESFYNVEHPDFDPRNPWSNRFRKKDANGNWVPV